MRRPENGSERPADGPPGLFQSGAGSAGAGQAAGRIRELAPGTWEREMERAVPPFALFVHTPLCGTCQAARKMLEVVAELIPEWTVVAANLNFMPGLAERWRIESVPCLLALDRSGTWHKWYRIGSVVDLAERFRELAEGGERT